MEYEYHEHGSANYCGTNDGESKCSTFDGAYCSFNEYDDNDDDGAAYSAALTIAVYRSLCVAIRDAHANADTATNKDTHKYAVFVAIAISNVCEYGSNCDAYNASDV